LLSDLACLFGCDLLPPLLAAGSLNVTTLDIRSAPELGTSVLHCLCVLAWSLGVWCPSAFFPGDLWGDLSALLLTCLVGLYIPEVLEGWCAPSRLTALPLAPSSFGVAFLGLRSSKWLGSGWCILGASFVQRGVLWFLWGPRPRGGRPLAFHGSVVSLLLAERWASVSSCLASSPVPSA
jgi:hypothetical protein